MKSYKKKDTKRFRKTRNKRRFNGGGFGGLFSRTQRDPNYSPIDPAIDITNTDQKNDVTNTDQETPDYRAKYIENDITNIEILAFLIQLLNTTDFKEKIITKNQQYLNSITSENIGASFHYGGNDKYRKFLNDVIQWFILDYNEDFFNNVLGVLLNCFKRPEFLLNNTDSFDILLDELNKMINVKTAKNSNTEDPKIKENNNNIFLLKLILELLTTIPALTKLVSDILINQKYILQQYPQSIGCIINYLMKKDIRQNEGVRKLIKNLITQEKLNILSAINTFAGIVECSWAVTKEASGNVAHKATTAVGNFANQITSVFGFPPKK